MLQPAESEHVRESPMQTPRNTEAPITEYMLINGKLVDGTERIEVRNPGQAGRARGNDRTRIARARGRGPLHSAQDKRNKSAIGGLRRERWGPERMARAELYREFARKCLELGYKVAPESRRVLFEMARIWHQWAQHQERGAAGRGQGAAP